MRYGLVSPASHCCLHPGCNQSSGWTSWPHPPRSSQGWYGWHRGSLNLSKRKSQLERVFYLIDLACEPVADTESRNYEAQSIFVIFQSEAKWKAWFKPQHSRFLDILTLEFSINTLWHSGILFQIKLLTQAGLAEKWGWKGQQGLWEETHWSSKILYIQTCGKCPSQFSTVETLQTAYLKPNISRLFK